MSDDLVTSILLGLFAGATVMDWLVWWGRPADYDWFQFWFAPVEIILGVIIAGSCIATGKSWLAGMYALGALVGFYNWWKRNNKRRKKLADKLAGRVIDIGGRLKIVVPVKGAA